MNNLIKKSRKLVGNFKHSAKISKKLKAVQLQLGIPVHRMVQDEPTRWNSTYYMLKRLLEQKDAIVLLSSKGDAILSVDMIPDDWKTMEFGVQLLEIFETATNQLSKENSTISEIIPLIHTVMKVTKNQDVSGSGLMGLKNDLISSMKRRYPSVEANLTLACATILDPRFKDLPFQSQDHLLAAKNKLLREMEGEDSFNSRIHWTDSSTTSGVPVSVEESSKEQGFWTRYAEIFSQSSPVQQPTLVGYAEELEQYLQEQPLNPNQADMLGSYWFSSPHLRLKQVAKKYLCVPPSTVLSERLFSAAGNICDQKRNRLDPERIKMLVFLNKNLK
ncbi:zinc finger BED domain-containing protein 4-like [Ischnura elegans]|uniref:zinc finger BED domain-containing protein 4-like n=1 Tax=Ischnura elegans TaxID=197161 RepID=UPI001ED888AE|nr:zinc finger BED domain-containing protein 4-like [Ischnura elegans]